MFCRFVTGIRSLVIFTIFVIFLAACGPSSQSTPESSAAATSLPSPTETQESPKPTIPPPPTETPEELQEPTTPPSTTEPTEEFIPVGTDLTTELPAGNAKNGELVFDEIGCENCHSLEEGVRIGGGGPTLFGIADRAETIKDGYSAELYLRESILLPGEYLGEGEYNRMKGYYGERLDAQDLADLIAFLMEQTE